ncbi:MAG: PQQ-like beta-propeller repeat protein [Planctomycetia bacterium]|nr:PQQ-like beta-propeller repeat protein [Planctomycetia bacterium]
MPLPGIIWIAALLAAACGRTAIADDEALEPWPRWRGVAGAGLGGDRQFPLEWKDDAWAWTAALPGSGHASPVIHDGRIFTASADEAAGRRFVTCHSLADGSLVWSREIPGPIDRHHAQNSSASGSVAVDDAGVYWMWAAQDGLRVEAWTLDGRPKWHVDLGPYAGEHGFGGSATVCGDLLIVPNDQEGESFVVALETAGGRERWRLPRESGKAGYATPLVIEAAAGRQLVLTSNAHGITGIDAATGRVLWESRCLPKRAVSSPVVAGPLVIGTSGDGGGDNTLVAVRMPEGGAATVEPETVFSLDRSIAPYVPTPLCVGPRLYLWGDRGVVTCVDAHSGAVRWRGRVGGTFSASPIAVGGTIRNVSADGEAVAIADGDSFEVLGRTALGEECRATPAVAGGRMVFRTTGRLLALDAAEANHPK